MVHPIKERDVKHNFVERLQNLVEAWQELVKPAMKHRKHLWNSYASGYLDERQSARHVLNLIDRGVSTVVPFLVEGDPQVLVETKVSNYRAWAYTTTLALNYLLSKMRFAETVLIPAAINSMFGSAITRTDFYYDRTVSLGDEQIKLGTPMVELIDDTNYVGDVAARRTEDFVFEGDIYTLPTSYARDFFGADWIEADPKRLSELNPAAVARGDLDRKLFSLREYSTFIDIYLRDTNEIITIMPKGNTPKILRTREWEGPGEGPYDKLGYKYVSDVPVPIPPAWSWVDMDDSANVVINKLRQLIESQKDVIGYTSESEEDVKRAMEAPNTGVIRQDVPNSLSQISLGGIKDQSNWDYLSFILQEQTKQGANPDVMAGRGAQAPTLGQEQLIYKNATRIVGNMYSRFHDFMTSIVRKLAWAYWTDPQMDVPVVRDIQGIGPIPEVFSSVDKVGDFYDFVFEIVPYSTQRTAPEIKYQSLMQLMTQWVLPTLEIGMQQGAMIDVPTTTETLANYLGLTNFKQLYRTVVPQPGEIVPYQMQPTRNRSEGGTSGMGSDAFGSTDGNRMAQSNRQATTETTKAATGVTQNE